MSNPILENLLYTIKVAKVIDDYTVVINKGRDNGIKEGQRVLIYAYDEEVIDPDTNISLGHLEIVKGTGRVTHVQNLIATVKSDMTSAPSRSIRKIKNTSPWGGALAMGRLFGGEEEIEETLPASTVPFDDPLKGDCVKLI